MSWGRLESGARGNLGDVMRAGGTLQGDAFAAAADNLLLVIVEAQVNTQHYGRRPYGVGFLVGGHDVRPRFRGARQGGPES